MSLTIEELRNHWQTLYGDTAPLGYRLREAFPERWFRIHTLPESKRYPENENERLEILRRHNTVLSELLEPNETFAIITVVWSPDATPEEPDNFFGQPLEWFCTKQDDEAFGHFWIGWHVWQPGLLDELLRQVMEDETRFLVVGLKQQCVYAPYDGGGDLILEFQAGRDTMRTRYADWLSTHPKGL
jgi:hypothetical protein